jgi:hypothetical protein
MMAGLPRLVALLALLAAAAAAAAEDAAPLQQRQQQRTLQATSTKSVSAIWNKETRQEISANDRYDDVNDVANVITNCSGPELGGVGGFASANGTCVLPANTTATLQPGTWLIGSGSLTLSKGAKVRCVQPGCLITVVLGGELIVKGNAQLSAGFINITAATVAVVGAGASIDADAMARGGGGAIRV